VATGSFGHPLCTYLVDAVIALTVFYKGFDNIDGFKKYLKMNSPNMMVLNFVFGLIHDFGLSTRLQELPLSHDGLFSKLAKNSFFCKV